MKSYTPNSVIVESLMQLHEIDKNAAERLDVLNQLWAEMNRGLDTRTAVLNILKLMMKEIEYENHN